jgi:acyl-CoA dehydrogenase
MTEELRARARSFVDEVLIPLEVKAERAGGRVPEEDVARIRSEAMARRLSGGSHAAEHGGQGWTTVEWFLVEEQLGRSTNALSWHIPRPTTCSRAGRRSRSTAGSGPRCAASCTTPTR